MSYYLGIDVGTSGSRAIIIDPLGKVMGAGSAAHTVQSPKIGYSEQDPEQWWSASRRAIKLAINNAKLPKKSISAIGLSGQMHGLVPLDAKGKVIRPAIIWNDQRSAEQCDEILSRAGGTRKLLSYCGQLPVASFTLTKLLWLRRHEPRSYDRLRNMVLPKDYVRFRLTGEYAGDVSDMSGTMLLDPRKRNWSNKMLDLFQIERDILPPVYESHAVTAVVSKSVAAELDLAEGTPVVAGGGDQPVGAVGNGIVTDGLVSATLGTSGVVYVHSRDLVRDPNGRVQTFCSCVQNEYCLFGCVLAAGGSLQWFRNNLWPQTNGQTPKNTIDPYELMTAEAATAAPGSGGLFWLPYLTGERTPHADPHARAGWIGITQSTTRAQLIRAVLEGATFGMNDVLGILRQRGLQPRQIRLSGGGARSDFWRQLQADIYNAACVTTRAEEGPAYGAAILAAVGASQYSSVPEACSAIIRVRQTIRPNAARAQRYAALHEQYQRLYPALKNEFGRISELAAEGIKTRKKK